MNKNKMYKEVEINFVIRGYNWERAFPHKYKITDKAGKVMEEQLDQLITAIATLLTQGEMKPID